MWRQTRSRMRFSPHSVADDSCAHHLVRVSSTSSHLFGNAAARSDHPGGFSNEGFLNTECDREPSPANVSLDLHAEIVGTFPVRVSADLASTAATPTLAESSLGPAAPCLQLPPSSSKNLGKKRHRAALRQAAAVEERSQRGKLGRVKPSTRRKHREASYTMSGLETQELRRAGGGSWIGLRDTKPKTSEVPSIEELMSTGEFEYVPYVAGRSTFVLDKDDVIVASLIDRPRGADWADVCNEASRCLAAVEEIGLQVGAFDADDMSTRRGKFLQVPVGLSMGGGQQKPTNLYSAQKRRQKINQSILQNRAIQRIAGFQSSAFSFTSPKLCQHYVKELGPVYENDYALTPNFENSIFPAASFNCGSNSVSLAHFDHNNLSFGQCTLTPLGTFDYQKGGHLVVYSLSRIFEFPAGTTFTLPSAAFKHGNTRLQCGGTRRSIAQYAAGALFRFKAYGFQTAKSLSSTVRGRAEIAKADKEPNQRWQEGLELYSTISSLSSDHFL